VHQYTLTIPSARSEEGVQAALEAPEWAEVTSRGKRGGKGTGLSWETNCRLPEHLSSIAHGDTGSPVWEGVVKQPSMTDAQLSFPPLSSCRSMVQMCTFPFLHTRASQEPLERQRSGKKCCSGSVV